MTAETIGRLISERDHARAEVRDLRELLAAANYAKELAVAAAESADAEVRALTAQLDAAREYMRHKQSCSQWTWPSAGGPQCDCGFYAALDALRAATADPTHADDCFEWVAATGTCDCHEAATADPTPNAYTPEGIRAAQDRHMDDFMDRAATADPGPQTDTNDG